MNKILFQLSFLIIPLSGCVHEQNQRLDKQQFKKANFEYFEIAFADGVNYFSLRIDSNKIFFLPNENRNVRYGILPDSIFKNIDTTVHLIQTDTSIQSVDGPCYDCDVLAINAKIGLRTIEIVQHGRISKPLRKIAQQLNSFIDKAKQNCNSIDAYLYLEASDKVFPPPPEIVPPSVKHKHKW